MWRTRCLVIAPVLAFVMTTLLLSCGGGTSTTAPIPTTTPITLIAVRICTQPPSTTASCAQATSFQVFLGSKGDQFFAQGQFSSNGVNSFQDISSSATWFVNNSLLTPDPAGGGFFDARTVKGCTCLTAASGTVVSAPVIVGVGQSPSTCTPCPPSP
jgi:hypothetical protein